MNVVGDDAGFEGEEYEGLEADGDENEGGEGRGKDGELGREPPKLLPPLGLPLTTRTVAGDDARSVQVERIRTFMVASSNATYCNRWQSQR